MYRSLLPRLAISLCILAALSFAPLALGWAQQASDDDIEFANPSDEQMSLNDDAVRAIVEGDYAGAVALLEEARALGELNVTYLNLGRAYQKLGQCEKARQALERALEAPAVERPSPQFVREKVGAHREELDAQCASSDDSAIADAGDDSGRDGAEKPIEGAGGDDGGSNVLGWSATIGGVALMAGGGAMFALAAGERAKIRSQPEDELVTERTMREAADIEKRANLYDTVGIATLGAGALVTGAGIYLLLSGDDATETKTSVSLGPDRVELIWRASF